MILVNYSKIGDNAALVVCQNDNGIIEVINEIFDDEATEIYKKLIEKSSRKSQKVFDEK